MQRQEIFLTLTTLAKCCPINSSMTIWRSIRGRGMDGTTPYQAFKAGLNKAKEARARPPKQEEKAA